MSSGSTSAGPRPRRRGLISCLHSPTCRANQDAPLLPDQDLPGAIYKLILGFYEKAFDRLPCETMPDLPRLLGTSGFCLGLLDPVSNIILNTIALLPPNDDHHGSSSPPAPKRSKRLARAALPGSDRGGCPWREAAIRSYYSLLDFLLTYFGCLSMKQAIRYLYRAGADLALAAMLVHHDLHKHDHMDLQPASARTQAALKWAADRVGHADPDTLAQVMAIRLQDGAFAHLKMLLAYGSLLTPDDVRYVHRVLHSLITPPCHAQLNYYVEQGLVVRISRNLDGVAQTTETVNVSNTDGSTTTSTVTTIRRLGQPITSMRSGLRGMLSECLELAYRDEDTLKSQCGDDCEYLESLKMCAHDMIHSFYIDALKLLMLSPSGSLMRIILMAGHCYGSLDPVSNIIVNTILYQKLNLHVEDPVHENIEPYTDILDPLSLLRPVVRSLKGLTTIAAFPDALFSIAACALETICSAKCHIANMLPSSGERLQIFHQAAMAAGYPLPIQLGELHRQLLQMPDGRNKLLSLITEAQTSCTVLPINEISFILDIMFCRPRYAVPLLFKAPKLCVEALSVVSKKRSQYEARRGVFRTKIEQLLEEYTSQHFWEPKYKLNFICGVEEIGRGPSCYYNKCYHVNFMATSELQLQKTLFFAEFWHSHEPKPSFCCPLPSAYAGRCYYGVDSARKLAYPDREEYILRDITERGTRNVHDMIETDIVYFSPERDVDVAKKLNKYYAGDFPVARRPAVLWC